MDFKQESLDDSGSEIIDVKEKPLFGKFVTSLKVEPNICESSHETLCIQKIKVEKETENVNSIHSQINQTTDFGCLHKKNNSVFVSRKLNVSLNEHDIISTIKLESPEIKDSEVQAKELCLDKSDIVKIKQEVGIKYELLTEECDLPIVKNEVDFLYEPCSSQQFLHLKKTERKRGKRRYICPLCQKGPYRFSSRSLVNICYEPEIFIRKLMFLTDYKLPSLNLLQNIVTNVCGRLITNLGRNIFADHEEHNFNLDKISNQLLL